MDRKLSDEQLDKIAKTLVQDFSLDASALDEIADSPKLWWNIKSEIAAEKERREKSRFGLFLPRLLAYGALAGVVCFGLTIFYLVFANNSSAPIAREDRPQTQIQEVAQTPVQTPAPNGDSEKAPVSPNSNPVPAKVSVKNAVPKTRFIAKNQPSEKPLKQLEPTSNKEISPRAAVAETKTDFIALSYAAGTDSGQIVRVKVPSSMMVSLGVKANVEKESELVSAEVVIGDDGLARAIRFIR